ncbi:2-isopropylmalate synthase [Clostridium sp.]|uniref:2-isopropylmalate synthase n=1 Tax=Clostridium sp. TaxID=1506 RepID=UPI001A45EB19|nr:2-isopropylmalate synthase [Clostridium sp.]MBK5241750.1 2-isopropylmalate synthase [Clostridium sp.]
MGGKEVGLKKIFIFDTTLRDGEQTPGVSLNVVEKLEIARALQKLGVDVIEAGFPIASDGDFEGVKTIAKNIVGPVITALARATKKDIDRAWEAIKYSKTPRIHTFLATSDLHMEFKLKMSREEVLSKVVEMVRYAKSLCPSVEFSPEDGTRTEKDFLYKVLEAAIDAGADVVNIPDTVGYTTPLEYGDLIQEIRKNVPNIDKAIISVHCHNDLGLAVSNSLAAMENGAMQIECAMNGLGERAGNASLEELVMAIKTRSDYFKCETNIASEELVHVSSLVSHMTGIQIQPNKAIVGANAFAHESGIHQHGVLNCRETYEIMTPESVGLKKSLLVLGKHSGRHAFENRLKDLGYLNIKPEKINEAFLEFKDLADKKKIVSDNDIEAMIRQETVKVPEYFKLVQFNIVSGNGIASTSTIKLSFENKTVEQISSGYGPVDATFNAIEKAIGTNIILKDYYLKAVGGGRDALGEVIVKIEKDSNIYVGNGVSTDIIEASAKAFVNALNKSHYRENIEVVNIEAS